MLIWTNRILLDNIEGMKEYGFLVYVLLPWVLSKMEVIFRHGIHSLIWIESL